MQNNKLIRRSYSCCHLTCIKYSQTLEPFMQWDIDLVNPMSPAPAKKDMIVATDYFTKWIEVEALSSTKDANKRLEGTEGKWVDELHGLLQAYQTTKRRSIGETLFSLAYETVAIIHPHITVPSMSIEVGSIG
ncbi:unnamed protein product [Prunus brigantina]